MDSGDAIDWYAVARTKFNKLDKSKPLISFEVLENYAAVFTHWRDRALAAEREQRRLEALILKRPDVN